MTNKVFPIRLSDSSLNTFNSCERKWQIEKRLVSQDSREESEHLVFGTAYGVGVATYMVTQNTDQAIYEAWMAYWPEIEGEKKSMTLLVSALLSAFPTLDTLLMDYEVATFNGKPAVELSFRLNINEGYYFVGYIDLVLRNKYTGVYSVFDAKSTGLALFDLSPLYRHSGQTVGYSIALDRIVGSELSAFGTGYIVAQVNAKSHSVKTHVLTYDKTLLDRLKWFMSLGQDVKRLEMLEETGHYPLRAKSCLTFNRPCFHFGSCHLYAFDVPKVIEEDTKEYDFVYELDELIEDHIRRIPA